jgi:hypothetical protein
MTLFFHLIFVIGFKEVTKVVALPDKPSVIALIDVEKEWKTTHSLLPDYFKGFRPKQPKNFKTFGHFSNSV